MSRHHAGSSSADRAAPRRARSASGAGRSWHRISGAPGRAASRRGVPGRAVPRRAGPLRRRLHRRRRLLRALRLPGHPAAAPGPDRPAGRSASGASTAAESDACCRPPSSCCSSPLLVFPSIAVTGRGRRRSPGRRGPPSLYVVELVLHRPVDRLLRRRHPDEPGGALLVAVGRGAVLPRLAAAARRPLRRSARRAGTAAMDGGAGCGPRRPGRCRSVAALWLARTDLEPGVLRHRHPGLPAAGRGAAGAARRARWPGWQRLGGSAPWLARRRRARLARASSPHRPVDVWTRSARGAGDHRRHAGADPVAGDPPGSGRSAALSWSPIVYLGRISYGTYLWHWLVIIVIVSLVDAEPSCRSLSSRCTGRHRSGGVEPRAPRATDPALGDARPTTGRRHRDGAGRERPGGLHRGAPTHWTSIAPGPSASRRATVEGTTPVPADLDWQSAQDDQADFPDCSSESPDGCTWSTAPGPHVLLLGDSHAGMYIPMFTELARGNGRSPCRWPPRRLPLAGRPPVRRRGRATLHRAPRGLVPGARRPHRSGHRRRGQPAVRRSHQPDPGHRRRRRRGAGRLGRVPRLRAGPVRGHDLGAARRRPPGGDHRARADRAIGHDDPLHCLSEATYLEECRFVSFDRAHARRGDLPGHRRGRPGRLDHRPRPADLPLPPDLRPDRRWPHRQARPRPPDDPIRAHAPRLVRDPLRRRRPARSDPPASSAQSTTGTCLAGYDDGATNHDSMA